MPSITLGRILISRPYVRYVTIFLILSLSISMGLTRGFHLLKKTTFEFKSPKGSPSDIANEILFEYFPLITFDTYSSLVIMKSNNIKKSIFTNITNQFEKQLYSALAFKYEENNLIFASYHKLLSKGIDYFAKELVNNATFPTVQIFKLGLKNPENNMEEFVNYIDDSIEYLGYKTALLSRKEIFVACTGPSIFARDIRKSTENDVTFIDSVTFPIAMIFLAIVFRSFRLLILPVISIFCVISLSMSIMYELTETFDFIKVTSLVPSIMMSSSIGFSIDYSLFLISRFREEMKKSKGGSTLIVVSTDTESRNHNNVEGVEEQTTNNNSENQRINENELKEDRIHRVENAVFYSFVYAGHTVLVSGCTLAFCWFVLLTFKVEIISSVGIGAGITTSVCVFVNLFLPPSFILSFPLFFSEETSFFSLLTLAKIRRRFIRRIRRLCRLFYSYILLQCSFSRHGYDEPFLNDISPPTQQIERVVLDRLPIILIENAHQVAMEMRYVEESAKRTFRVTRFVTSSKPKACFIFSLLTLFLFPFAYYAWNYNHSDSFSLMIPRNFPGTKAFNILEEEFGRGRLSPYRLIVMPEDENMDKDTFYLFVQTLIQEMLLKDEHVKEIECPVYLFRRFIRLQEFKHCLAFPNSNSFCRNLMYLSKFSLSAQINAVAIKIELGIEPNSVKGGEWLKSLRNRLNDRKVDDKMKYYLAQGDAISNDVIDSVYEHFPKAIVFTCSVVLIAEAIAFKSLIVPLRALFSICATLCFVYGSAVMVFQYDLLKFLNFNGLQSPTKEIFWVSPIMLFGVLCGISLDYDTFSLTRIVEYRTVGFSNIDSIRAGLASSFKVVTMAGFIMTTAFCGMLFSGLPVLNQISFFLVTAILFDTFVVRILYVPSLMILLGNYNWWPRKELVKWETQS